VIILFLRANMMARMGILVAAVIVLLFAPLVLPRSVTERYMLIFSAEGSEELQTKQAEFAAGSTEGRGELLKESLLLTARNPVFGVGLGMFSVAAADDYKQQRIRAMWLQTHNLYTQVSSELGLVGLILYLSGIYKAFLNFRYVEKVARQVGDLDMLRMAQWLSLSFYVILLNGFFSSTAYHLPIIVLFSTSQIIRNVVRPQSVAH